MSELDAEVFADPPRERPVRASGEHHDLAHGCRLASPPDARVPGRAGPGSVRTVTTERPTVAEVSQRFVASLTAAHANTLSGARRVAGAGMPVKFSGRSAPGPGGVLTAPFSGRPCVWYRSVTSPFDDPTTREVHTTPKPPGMMLSSAYPPPRAGVGARNEQQVDESSAPFRITDGTADVQIDPGAAVVDSAVVTTNELRRDSGRRMALCQEWILPPDQDVLAVGVAERADAETVRLGADAYGPPIVSTHDEAFLLSRARAGANAPDPRKILTVVVAVALIFGTVLALAVFGVL